MDEDISKDFQLPNLLDPGNTSYSGSEDNAWRENTTQASHVDKPVVNPPPSNQAVPVFLSVIIFITNVMFLITLRKYKRLQRAFKMKVLLANIACAYILFSVVALSNSFLVFDTRRSCLVRHVLFGTSMNVTVSGVLLLALEIYLVSKSTSPAAPGLQAAALYGLIAGSWLTWLTLHACGSIYSKDTTLTYPCMYTSPYFRATYLLIVSDLVVLHFPCIIALHVSMLLHFRANIRKIQGRRHTQAATPSDQVIIQHLRTHQGFANLVLVLCVIFVLSWVPLCSMTVYHYATSRTNSPLIPQISAPFLFINGVTNFFIYLLYSKDFRKAFRQTFCPCCIGHIQGNSSSDS